MVAALFGFLGAIIGGIISPFISGAFQRGTKQIELIYKTKKDIYISFLESLAIFSGNPTEENYNQLLQKQSSTRMLADKSLETTLKSITGPAMDLKNKKVELDKAEEVEEKREIQEDMDKILMTDLYEKTQDIREELQMDLERSIQ